MASVYHPRPVLSSQRYSPAPEYVDSRRRLDHGHPPPQLQTFNGVLPCYPAPMTTLPPSMSLPIVPSQQTYDYDYLYRASAQVARPQQPRLQRKNRSQINPLYFWPAFRQYRNRQAHKDTQKDKGGVWRRPELEDAFVDAVLLMPHMGRRKFSMGGKLHGRNMLISEYIFVICIALLGSKEIFRIDNSNESIEQMGRKQVSSHMQVVKKFFEDLRCFHFLFPSEDKKEPGSTNSDEYYDEEEQESFKSNPVLTALAEGRVPDVKPNYAYFSELLGLQSLITVRPKTCEVFVSSAQVKMRDEVAYDADDTPLDQATFPHLNKYPNAEDYPNILGRDVLLHEYTRSLDRATSACVKTVTRRWQKEAPALYELLNVPARDEECLLLEMCATLDLHEQARFPSGSELTGFVEVAITQPGLQNHHWKCVTRLSRPDELRGGDDTGDGVYTNESGIHRRGCSDSASQCDCHLRARSEMHVPFPAVQWASILSTAAQYPDVEHRRKKEKRRGQGQGQGQETERVAGGKRKRSADEGDAASWGRREPTGSDLICRVAMCQELWSRAADSAEWTRQAMIFWRFETTNQWHKYSAVFKPAGTTWRWLTVNDPMSRHHQQQALRTASSMGMNMGVNTGVNTGVTRDAVMSPTPSVRQHLTAAMSENFSSAWENGTSVPPLQTNMSLFESFPNGLATPPPTASSMPSSYPAGFAGVGFLDAMGSRGSPSASLAYLEGPATAGFVAKGGGGEMLDMSSQTVYDNSTAMHGWSMGMDAWAGSAVTSAGSSSHQQAMWNPGSWPLPAGGVMGGFEEGKRGDDEGDGGDERQARGAKRRKTEGTGWCV